MVLIIRKLDEITFMAKVKDRYMIIYEFENELALGLHLQERKLLLEIEQGKIDL